MTVYYDTNDGKPGHITAACPYMHYGYCTKCVPVDVTTETGKLRYYLDQAREEIAREKSSAELWRKVIDDEGRELARALGWNPDEYSMSYGWDSMLSEVRLLAHQSDDVSEDEESVDSRGDLAGT